MRNKKLLCARSRPDGYSVNVRCLDEGAVRVTRVTLFDGQHWEAQMAKLAAQTGQH
jgi:hypothetical protein